MTSKISFIVPCWNEREGIPHLLTALEETRRLVGPGYEWEFIFVDDGSSDGTAELLEVECLGGSDVRVIRHAVNRGLGAALRTGFAQATGELVVTNDSDCTFDPRELPAMLRLLAQGADIVAASPYHPRGSVLNVPAYRLLLSRNLSRLYRWVLGTRLHSYTSLFRLYRGEVIKRVSFTSDDFLAVTQILVGALRAGYRVVEHPTRLSVRRYGASKARIPQMILDHLGHLWQLICRRPDVAPRAGSLPPQAPEPEEPALKSGGGPR